MTFGALGSSRKWQTTVILLNALRLLISGSQVRVLLHPPAYSKTYRSLQKTPTPLGVIVGSCRTGQALPLSLRGTSIAHAGNRRGCVLDLHVQAVNTPCRGRPVFQCPSSHPVSGETADTSGTSRIIPAGLDQYRRATPCTPCSSG